MVNMNWNEVLCFMLKLDAKFPMLSSRSTLSP